MKKDKRSNVVPFPNLKERLVDKGMAALKSKHYQEALELFSEAKKMEEDKAEIHLGIALCLMELGELEEAKNVCKKMLQEDLGHYYTVMQIYLTILIQLREYGEVQATIEAVLEENHLPAESAEHFYKLLEFSRKMNTNKEIEFEDVEVEARNPQFENLLQNTAAQVEYVHSLKDLNITKHLGVLQTILADPQGHPVVKSMILQLMMENEISKKVTVTKFGESMIIIPDQLEDLADLPFTKKIISMLDDTLGNENPTLFEAAKDLWIRHMYVLYPFLPQPADVKLWAAAVHKVGYEMHGIEIEEAELNETYNLNQKGLTNACQKIMDIEKISYL
ncbi:tetratricopeptide repeat protein [Metabacillus arenae]|uniref:Tetratricopeptide repeat protein n=1 Tax=Metabacillus arenae TaxID=2771434 RepID=A0A926NJL0_9BACI|nr:tetratricopeptide repeat protein [Metabacillus arenae]MBD1381173.1 tetratricopeptide repeat protein [Metabacillus arenae]